MRTAGDRWRCSAKLRSGRALHRGRLDYSPEMVAVDSERHRARQQPRPHKHCPCQESPVLETFAADDSKANGGTDQRERPSEVEPLAHCGHFELAQESAHAPIVLARRA